MFEIRHAIALEILVVCMVIWRWMEFINKKEFSIFQ